MKCRTLLLVILIVVLALAFTGCGASDEKPGTKEEPTPKPTVTTVDPVYLGKNLYKFTFVGVKVKHGSCVEMVDASMVKFRKDHPGLRITAMSSGDQGGRWAYLYLFTELKSEETS